MTEASSEGKKVRVTERKFRGVTLPTAGHKVSEE